VRSRIPVPALIILTAALSSCLERSGGDVTKTSAVDVTIPVAPQVLYGSDQHAHVVYELFLENKGQDELTIDRLRISAELTGPPLAEYETAALSDILFHGQEVADTDRRRVVKTGEKVGAYLWLTFATTDRIPKSLQHSILVRSGEKQLSVAAPAPVRVTQPDPTVIGPPLKDGPWLAGHGPSNDSKHRRSPVFYMRRLSFSQRFAFDFVLLGKNGRAFNGESVRNESWFGNGSDVLAVEDGTVVLVKDGVPENVPLTARPPADDVTAMAGNSISLGLGRNIFAIYGHLKPGSIRVTIGEHVRRGQVLGSLGNSGNSDFPHLHFQICNGPLMFDSEGLPFVFDSFNMSGSSTMAWATAMEPEGAPPPELDLPKELQRRIPLLNTVVAFSQ
jgi:murein DD-endopeptidase MepM/ murein hydrolase activator NlpD